MPQFQNSPGVYTNEIDLTGSVPSATTSSGAISGVFRWGPVNVPVEVDQEKTLVSVFGPPSNLNPETWFTAANFAGYSDSTIVVRVANTSGSSSDIANSTLTAVAASTTTPSNTVLLSSVIENTNDYLSTVFDPSVYFAAKYPGALGNSLRVSYIDSANAFTSSINLAPNTDINTAATSISFVPGSNTATITIVPSATGTGATTSAVAASVASSLSVGDLIQSGNSSVGTQVLKVSSIANTVTSGANASITVSFTAPYTQVVNTSAVVINRQWEFFGSVNKSPSASAFQLANGNSAINDTVHVVVTDALGAFTGSPGKVLEVFQGLSRASNAKDDTNSSIFYKTVINNTSKYIWVGSDVAGSPTATANNLVASTNSKATTINFVGGKDGLDEATIPLQIVTNGYAQFSSADNVADIAVIMQGKARGGVNGEGLANYITSNICETRKDLRLTVSPDYNDVVNQSGNEVTNIVQFRNSLISSSYQVLDSGYKYQYDQYNDVYRYIPLNGDIAGAIVSTSDPWVSPGNSKIRNVIKLAFNPNQTARDQLYKNDINPVVSLQGQGPVLYGDKTTLGTTSAFSRIGVRGLFITVRKSIARASAAYLFKFNDAFTRAQFRNLVEPYLRDVQARRGITDYKVVCDDSNNTSDVIDNEGFVGDVYIKPSRSINFIQLNFVSVDDSDTFAEVIGQY